MDRPRRRGVMMRCFLLMHNFKGEVADMTVNLHRMTVNLHLDLKKPGIVRTIPGFSRLL